jgi:uncharacterized membrane protein YfcA
MSVVAAIAIGVAAGVSSGLMGIGGGILFVPALSIFLDQSQIEAEATSLLAIVPVALVGAWRQARYGNVRREDGIAIGLLSPLGVAAGAVLANALSQRTLEIAFALLVLGFAYRFGRRALSPVAAPSSPGGRRIDVD